MIDAVTGDRYIYLKDGRNSVYQIQKEGISPVEVAKTYQYDSFGNIISETGDLENPFAYTGREWEPDLGLYYYRARWYDPAIGRFLSEDPIRFGAGPNLHSYVLNNAVNLIDPFGLTSITFDRSDEIIYVYPGEPNMSDGTEYNQSMIGGPATFPAGNNTTSTSNGPWPNGTYPYDWYAPHPESGANDAYGSSGNFFFDEVPGRESMGVHSGRADRGGSSAPTRGCVRTTDAGTGYISEEHSGGDPIEIITIRD